MNSTTRWRLVVTKTAKKHLEKLPDEHQVRLENALDALQLDPFSGDIKRLHGVGGWRRRVGDYRILYELDIERRMIFVTAIVRRTSTTY